MRKDQQSLGTPTPCLSSTISSFFFENVQKNKKIKKNRNKEEEEEKFFEHTKPDSSINFTVFIFNVLNALSLYNIWLVFNIQIALGLPAAVQMLNAVRFKWN